MSSFDFLWQMVEKHGSVARFHKAELERLWDEYTLEEQRKIYCSIRDKLRAGKFVNYNPVIAVQENAPQAQQPQILSFEAYYKRYHTTYETDGWQMKYLPEEQRTIYVKQL